MQFINIQNIIILLLSLMLLISGVFYIFKKLIWLKQEKKIYKKLALSRNYRYYNINIQTFANCVLIVLFIINTIFLMLRFVSGIDDTANSYNSNIDVMFVVDSSLSMQVSDTDEGSRLDSSKKYLLDFIQNQNGHRFGLVTYNSEALVESPLTTDKETIKIALTTITAVDSFRAEGSSVAIGIDAAQDRILAKNEIYGANRTKILIIVSDGEEIESNSNYLDSKIAELSANDIKVFTLGVGSEIGDKIPTYIEVSTGIQQYVPNPNGLTFVVSKLEEGVLKKIATQTGGEYMKVDEIKKLERLINKEVNQLNSNSQQSIVYKETYYIFALLDIIICLLIFIDFDKYKVKIRNKSKQ